MTINFNQKQWRQDLAAFISKKRFWFQTQVTRSKTIEKKTKYNDSVKEFSIYNRHGGEEIVRYVNQNQIVYTTNEDLLTEYYETKGFKRN